MAGLRASLEADLRALATEARRQDGFTSWITGAAQNLDVKDAAERAVLKLRALPSGDGAEAIASHEARESAAAETRRPQLHASRPPRRPPARVPRRRAFIRVARRPAPPPPRGQDILRPFVMACACRNSNLTALGLAGIHKLAAHSAVAPARFASLFESLQQARAVRAAALPRPPRPPRRP